MECRTHEKLAYVVDEAGVLVVGQVWERFNRSAEQILYGFPCAFLATFGVVYG